MDQKHTYLFYTMRFSPEVHEIKYINNILVEFRNCIAIFKYMSVKTNYMRKYGNEHFWKDFLTWSILTEMQCLDVLWILGTNADTGTYPYAYKEPKHG